MYANLRQPLLFTLKEASGKKLHEFTKSHLRRAIGVVIEGEIMQSSHIFTPFGKEFMLGASPRSKKVYNRLKTLQIQCSKPKN